jgi:hypothetical protein
VRVVRGVAKEAEEEEIVDEDEEENVEERREFIGNDAVEGGP